MDRILWLFLLIGIIGCAGTSAMNDELKLAGKWQVETIAGSPVIDRSQAYIQFAEDGRVNGNSSCNQFSGSYTQSGSELSFGQMASTRKMCPDHFMEQETRFLEALAMVAKVEMQNELLLLLDNDGKELITGSYVKE